MIRKLPIIPTLIVLVAVGIMIRLGFWQLDRLHQKEAMLARYAAVEVGAEAVEMNSYNAQGLAYRRVSSGCGQVANDQLVAGRNAQGEAGWAHIAVCTLYGFDIAPHYAIVLGWSRDPKQVRWIGGNFTGVLVPAKKSGITMPPESRKPYEVSYNLDYHIVADPPLAGLQPNAKPDPSNIPNNHLAYAVQWFLFAGVALVIYVLALRKRTRP